MSASSNGRSRFWLAALLVLVTAVLHGTSLDEFFYKDDFALLARARACGLSELLTRRVADHFQGENEWFYWRPGWWIVVEVAHRIFGLDPLGYRAGALFLHALLVLACQTVVARLTGRPLPGFLAGFLFATTPAPIEGVVWIAAAANVLPAAFFVGASGIAWFAHLQSGSARASAWALAFFALSFLFREAAYHLPLLFLVGWILVRGVPRSASDWMRCGIPLLIAVALVAFHYVRLDRHPTPVLSPAAWAERVASNLDTCVALFAPFAVHPPLWRVAALSVFAGFFLAGSTRARYFLVWAAFAAFPYAAAEGYSSRFAYFCAFPLSIGLALGAHDLWLRAGREAAALATAWLVAIGCAGAVRFPSVLEPYAESARSCRQVLDDCRTQRVERFDRLCVDFVPWELVGGMEAMLDLFLGKTIELENAAIVVRAPFAIHLTAIPEEDAGQGFLTVSAKTGRAKVCSRGELVRGLVPIPLVSFQDRWRVVSDPSEALDLVRGREVDLGREVLLEELPSFAPSPGAAGRAVLLDLERTPAGVELELSCPAETLLVLAWQGQGETRAAVDGRPARILRANGIFQAIELPAGTRRVVWEGRWKF